MSYHSPHLSLSIHIQCLLYSDQYSRQHRSSLASYTVLVQNYRRPYILVEEYQQHHLLWEIQLLQVVFDKWCLLQKDRHVKSSTTRVLRTACAKEEILVSIVLGTNFTWNLLLLMVGDPLFFFIDQFITDFPFYQNDPWKLINISAFLLSYNQRLPSNVPCKTNVYSSSRPFYFKEQHQLPKRPKFILFYSQFPTIITFKNNSCRGIPSIHTCYKR